jgi:hypothetical protein
MRIQSSNIQKQVKELTIFIFATSEEENKNTTMKKI